MLWSLMLHKWVILAMIAVSGVSMAVFCVRIFMSGQPYLAVMAAFFLAISYGGLFLDGGEP